VALADARTLSLSSPVDLVLTSPPYPSTYDYLPMQHLRTVWLGVDPGAGEIGARRFWRQGGKEARRAWSDDTHRWTARVAAALRPGGALVVLIGDGLTPSGEVDTSAPTEEAAKAAGLQTWARASVPRPDHARGTVRWEHCFVFGRADRGGVR
jgi:DNA modification methylase